MQAIKNHKRRTIGDDFVFARKTRQTNFAGLWIVGTLNGHRFSALVFSQHADCPAYELGTSRISKLWLQRLDGGLTVANFDRGWDVRPTTKTAQAIVDYLADNLARLVFDN